MCLFYRNLDRDIFLVYQSNQVQDNSSLNEHQRNIWKGEFGDLYVERNKTIKQVNESFNELMGITLEDLLFSFFNDLNRKYKILDSVGTIV